MYFCFHKESTRTLQAHEKHLRFIYLCILMYLDHLVHVLPNWLRSFVCCVMIDRCSLSAILYQALNNKNLSVEWVTDKELGEIALDCDPVIASSVGCCIEHPGKALFFAARMTHAWWN